MSRFGPLGAAPRLLLEIPHGATERRHFDAVAARLAGPLPADLHEFFHVNTDEGAPELAEAIVRRLGASIGGLLLRATLPRTLVDCNRVVSGTIEAGMTAGVPAYVRHPDDRALLLDLHARYAALAAKAYATVCADGSGLAVTPHTFAPRSIDVAVDDDIVTSLRRAYAQDQIGRWPLRPELDLIVATEAGERLAPAALVESVRSELAAAGLEVATNATYALHPATAAFRHSRRYPGQVLCFEARRDLLGDPWLPFSESTIGPEKVERIAAPLARALAAALDSLGAG